MQYIQSIMYHGFIKTKLDLLVPLF